MQTALASVEDLPVLPPMAAPSAGYRHYYSSFGAAARCACLPEMQPCQNPGGATTHYVDMRGASRSSITPEVGHASLLLSLLSFDRPLPAAGPREPAERPGGAGTAVQAAAVQGAWRAAVPAGLFLQRGAHRAARHHGRHRGESPQGFPHQAPAASQAYATRSDNP